MTDEKKLKATEVYAGKHDEWLKTHFTQLQNKPDNELIKYAETFYAKIDLAFGMYSKKPTTVAEWRQMAKDTFETIKYHENSRQQILEKMKEIEKFNKAKKFKFIKREYHTVEKNFTKEFDITSQEDWDEIKDGSYDENIKNLPKTPPNNLEEWKKLFEDWDFLEHGDEQDNIWYENIESETLYEPVGIKITDKTKNSLLESICFGMEYFNGSDEELVKIANDVLETIKKNAKDIGLPQTMVTNKFTDADSVKKFFKDLNEVIKNKKTR